MIKFAKESIQAYLRANNLLMTDMRAKEKTQQYTHLVPDILATYY